MDIRTKKLSTAITALNKFLTDCREANQKVERAFNSQDKESLTTNRAALHDLHLAYKTDEYKTMIAAVEKFVDNQKLS